MGGSARQLSREGIRPLPLGLVGFFFPFPPKPSLAGHSQASCAELGPRTPPAPGSHSMALNSPQEGQARGRVPAQPPAGDIRQDGEGASACGAETVGVSPVPRGWLWQAQEAPERELPRRLQGWILPAVLSTAGHGDPPELWGKPTAVGQPPRAGSPNTAGLALPWCWGTWAAPEPLRCAAG